MPASAAATDSGPSSDGSKDAAQGAAGVEIEANGRAYSRFQELLRARQVSTGGGAQDIRKRVLSLRSEPVGFGINRETLKSKFGRNLGNVFSNVKSFNEPGFEKCRHFFSMGTIHENPRFSHPGAIQVFNRAQSEADIFLMETCFLATTHSWKHSMTEGDPKSACLGYVYDDIAHYFMAEYPNRLIRKLNSNEELGEKQFERSRKLVEQIVEKRITKYNAQPIVDPPGFEDNVPRVLVCDQTYADASTVYGKVGEAEFERMLQSALDENPEAEIIVKTHPDTVWIREKRTGYYNHLESSGRIKILRDPINPYKLFKYVDKVYVGTSQMGLEALFAGKTVVCFGLPFYAGWGLTDDRQAVPHRNRRRRLEDLFHYAYVWYSIYHLPNATGPSEIEQVLAFIEENRPDDGTRKAQRSSAVSEGMGIVSYGFFGWRLWFLTPLLELLFFSGGRSKSRQDFRKDPAGFARSNWEDNHPVLCRLLYPNTNPMGPGNIFRIWVPVVDWIASRFSRPEALKKFRDNPIYFVRSSRRAAVRFAGRMMFPLGELVRTESSR